MKSKERILGEEEDIESSESLSMAAEVDFRLPMVMVAGYKKEELRDRDQPSSRV